MADPAGFGKLKKRALDDCTPEERVEWWDLLRLLDTLAQEQPDPSDPGFQEWFDRECRRVDEEQR